MEHSFVNDDMANPMSSGEKDQKAIRALQSSCILSTTIRRIVKYQYTQVLSNLTFLWQLKTACIRLQWECIVEVVVVLITEFT